MAAILSETQYYHIPSIRNGDAAYAARAIIMLRFRAAQLALSQSNSMLVYLLRCLELTLAQESRKPTLQL